MSERDAVLYVRIPVKVTDPEWDDGTLQDNAVDAVQTWLERGQDENEATFGPGAYHLVADDCTVWAEVTFAADLRDKDGSTRSTELDSLREKLTLPTGGIL